MKKSYLFGMFALAALTMVGCSNDEVVNDYSQDNAIQFGTYMGRDVESRGEIFTTDDLKKQGFGVYAYYTGQTPWANANMTAPNFMNNTKVTYDETANGGKGAWTYSPIKYWPNNKNDKVSFFAYAPYDLKSELKGGATSITYTVPQKVKEHIDLTWNNSATTDLTKQAIDGVVEFKFQHALAKIGFTYQVATDEVKPGEKYLDEATTIWIKRVILSKGEVTYDESTKKYSINSAFHKTATLNFNNTTAVAAWSNHKDNQYYEISEEGLNFKNNLINHTNSLNKTELNMDDSFMMIIPQDFSIEGFNVFVEYQVVTKGENAAGKPDNSDITNRVNQTVALNLESGKQYNLNLIIGMTSVKVEAEAGEWVTVGEQEVVLPEENTEA